MKEKFNFDESLKAVAVQYRGVYQNTILDWQPDEEHGYPEGTNIYIKEQEQWVPYTGVFFVKEYFLYNGTQVSLSEVRTFLQNAKVTKITVFKVVKNSKIKGYVYKKSESLGGY